MKKNNEIAKKTESKNEITENNTENFIDSSLVIENIIKEKSVCLEVKCKDGKLGEILTNSKKCKVYGIEDDNDLLKASKKKKCYKELYNFSITDSKKTGYKKFFEEDLKFDYIIFANVLEYIEKPEEVLVVFSKKLKRNGKIIVSLPNIAHINIYKKFLNKTFHYKELELSENKKQRVFTKSSFLEMIDDINHIDKISLFVNTIEKLTEEPTEYLKNYPNLYKLLNKDKEANVIEYIYIIEKKKSIEEKKEIERNYFELLEKEIQDRVLFSQQLKLQRQENVNLLNQIRIEGEVNQKLTKENEIFQQELERIKNSRSWKITKPFRKIMEHIENRKQ